VEVASAGLYASLHLIPDNHANIPPLSFFTGWMPFLPPNQQRQSNEGRNYCIIDAGYCYRCLYIELSCLSVCVSVLFTTMSPEKMAEPIKILFGDSAQGTMHYIGLLTYGLYAANMTE